MTNARPMPRSMRFNPRTTSPQEVTIEATIYPSTATNKKVDYYLEWGLAPTNCNKPVTDFVTVTQADEGSTIATVRCIKNFGSDQIILTVKTRDGNFEDTCQLFCAHSEEERVPIEIDTSSLTRKNSVERGDYFYLEPSKTYELPIPGAAYLERLNVDVVAVGAVYMGNSSTDGYTTSYTDIVLKTLQDHVHNFLTANVVDGKLVIERSNIDIENYAAATVTDEYLFIHMTDRVVLEDLSGVTGTAEYQMACVENARLIPKTYIDVIVSDEVSGLKGSIRVSVSDEELLGIIIDLGDLDYDR